MRDKVAQLVAEHLPEDNPQVLDIGCGEGYYTYQIYQQLKSKKSTSLWLRCGEGCH